MSRSGEIRVSVVTYKVTMNAAEPQIREQERPTILVMVVPYVLATAMEANLRGRYNVVAPDLDAGEAVPSMRSDAVLSGWCGRNALPTTRLEDAKGRKLARGRPGSCPSPPR